MKYRVTYDLDVEGPPKHGGNFLEIEARSIEEAQTIADQRIKEYGEEFRLYSIVSLEQEDECIPPGYTYPIRNRVEVINIATLIDYLRYLYKLIGLQHDCVLMLYHEHKINENTWEITSVLGEDIIIWNGSRIISFNGQDIEMY